MSADLHPSPDAGTSIDRHHASQQIDMPLSHYAQISGPEDDVLTEVLTEVLTDALAHIKSLQQQLEATRQCAHKAEARNAQLQVQLADMRKLACEDPMTGCLNRRGMDEVFGRELARAGRNSLPLCIVMLDLDNFKLFNDEYGHSVGDAALIHVAQVIKDTLRLQDVVCRYGGEEFLLLLPDTSIEFAANVVHRLQHKLELREFKRQQLKAPLTFSAGIALHLQDENQASFVGRADDGLYAAKRAGKNCIVVAKTPN